MSVFVERHKARSAARGSTLRATLLIALTTLCGRGQEAAVAMTKTVLDDHVGQRFPNLTLIDRHGAVVRLDQLRVGRTAVLFAGWPNPDGIAWMREFEAQKWAPPPGYARLVIIASLFGDHAFNSLVRKAPSCFLVGWPLEDYLTSVRISPILFDVSAEGALQGYSSFEDRGNHAASHGSESVH